MGTTLTGLTPATTYDALIKVGDNGPLSATAKYVGDGLGNDSVVALSTSSVGIGTTSPTQLLHVAGNVRITGALYDGNNAAGTSGQILSSTGTATDWIDVSSLGVVDGSGTANYVSKWSDPNTLTNSVIYDNGTNVGIGTSSPQARLEVPSGSPTSAEVQRWSYNTANPDFSLRLRQDVTTGLVKHVFDLVNNSTTYANNLVLTNGNVGIGTSSPAAKLHVAFPSDGTAGAIFGYTGGSNNPRLFFNVNESTSKGQIIVSGSSGALDFGLGAGGAEIITLKGSGNVGIGTTSPAFKLEVNGNAYCTDLSLPAAGGIYFDSGASKYLDDYEVGTWTPATSTSGYTISASSGSYTKIGRQVTIRGQFSFSAINASSSSFVIISGLPFTSASDFSGSLREGTNTGAIYTARVNSGQTNATCNSMDGVATASARIFAINENYDLNVTYFV